MSSCERLLLEVLCELNILLSPCSKILVGLCNLVEEGLDLVELALAGCDDGPLVGHLCLSAVSSLLGLIETVGKDVSKNCVVAASGSVLEVLDSLLIVAGENIHDTLVGLGIVGTGLLEVVGGGSVVTLAESDHTESVVKVTILGLNIGECLGGVVEIAGVEIGDTEVEPGSVTVELGDSLVVKLYLLVEISDESCSVQESRLVEDVAVAVNQLDEFIGGVVLSSCYKDRISEVCLNFGSNSCNNYINYGGCCLHNQFK